jgi:hypothetical protein
LTRCPTSFGVDRSTLTRCSTFLRSEPTFGLRLRRKRWRAARAFVARSSIGRRGSSTLSREARTRFVQARSFAGYGRVRGRVRRSSARALRIARSPSLSFVPSSGIRCRASRTGSASPSMFCTHPDSWASRFAASVFGRGVRRVL